MIPYGKHTITQKDIASVVKVLKSDFLTQGPAIPKFEKTVSNYCNVKYSVATNSATSALHLACLALGLVSNDWLWTSPITFVASANCGLYCGARVDFVDIDSSTFNICPKQLEQKLIFAKKNNILPKIVVAVAIAGQSCNMVEIYKLSKKYGFKIIEDASHAIGAKYKENPVGNCKYSDITVFSFHPVKIITTGEGGMALTNNKKLADKMILLRSHGITRNSKMMTKPTEGNWYYQQIQLGFNYRMTDIQAALGNNQMKKIDKFISKRHVIAGRYNETLSKLPVRIPYQNKDNFSSFHLYIILLNEKDDRVKSREVVYNTLRKKGIGVNVHYIPVHTQPYYQSMGFKIGDFPKAEDFYNKAISLPIFPTLKKKDQDKVINNLTKIFK